jgi:hypothetical protein
MCSLGFSKVLTFDTVVAVSTAWLSVFKYEIHLK